MTILTEGGYIDNDGDDEGFEEALATLSGKMIKTIKVEEETLTFHFKDGARVLIHSIKDVHSDHPLNLIITKTK